MTDRDKSDRNINISDNEGETNIGSVVGGDVHGDAVGGDSVGGDKVGRDKIGGDKVGRDKITHEQQTTFDQRNQRAETQYNAAGDIIFGQTTVPPRDKNLTTLLRNVRKIWVAEQFFQHVYQQYPSVSESVY